MDSHSTYVVTPDQLCVGLHIHLDLPWISHPFAFPSFKISSPEQIAQIRRLGLKEIRYSPAKSDCQPLIVLPRDDAVAPPSPSPNQRAASPTTPQTKPSKRGSSGWLRSARKSPPASASFSTPRGK